MICKYQSVSCFRADLRFYHIMFLKYVYFSSLAYILAVGSLKMDEVAAVVFTTSISSLPSPEINKKYDS